MARIIGVASKPEPDGSFVLEIATAEGQRIEASLASLNVPLFLRTMQKSLIEQYTSDARGVFLPEFDVTDISLGNLGTTTELVVSTNQVSTFMVLLSDELLTLLRRKIVEASVQRGTGVVGRPPAMLLRVYPSDGGDYR